MPNKEIPVYLFVGFLDSGKTRFVQETLEDPRFDAGKNTLLLVCEEGEEEYNPKKFAFPGVTVSYLEDKSELNPENLSRLEAEAKAGRVVIEYNGMWTMQELYTSIPENWVIYQCLMTADSKTALTYARDNSMRSLFLDKIAPSELIVFNRAEAVEAEGAHEELHRLVRQATRKCDIAYEYADGIWFLDCQDEPEKYNRKTVRFLAQVYKSPKAGKNSFVPGRFAMTCCAADIQFVGFPCVFDDYRTLNDRDWVKVTAKVNYKMHFLYRGRKGPVLTALSVEPAEKPAEDVVTFS